ncbi:MAG: D-aminoacyl-tRNA deacylase [Polyangiaceae bacterium]
MRAVVQRVARARVTVDGEEVGSIGRGLLVYLGAGDGDGDAERDALLAKILALRIFTAEGDAGTGGASGKMDRNVLDVGGSLLVVSQFTLYADTKKGNRPSFTGAMAPEPARAMVDAFVTAARKSVPVATGRFGADMQVESVNDGPVTILLERAPTPAPLP